jgi:hypothetical protein
VNLRLVQSKKRPLAAHRVGIPLWRGSAAQPGAAS